MESKQVLFEDCTPKNIAEVLWMGEKIIRTVRENPMDDKVFVLPMYNNVLKETDHDTKYCIAGSSAVVLFSKLLKGEQHRLRKMSDTIANYKIFGDFKSSDTDIFFLGAKEPHRKQINDVDIVHVKENSASSLILNFDLNCCRAAINEETETLWVSAQCIYSLLTGEYFLPSYLATKEEFKIIFEKNNDRQNKLSEDQTNKLTDNLFKRLTFRIAKYEHRGYKCTYFDTKEILKWINHRFFYEELLLSI